MYHHMCKKGKHTAHSVLGNQSVLEAVLQEIQRFEVQASWKPLSQSLIVGESLIAFVFCVGPRFPKDYPTGCLLGCVNVTDCLSQEQFRQQVSET